MATQWNKQRLTEFYARKPRSSAIGTAHKDERVWREKGDADSLEASAYCREILAEVYGDATLLLKYGGFNRTTLNLSTDALIAAFTGEKSPVFIKE